MNSIVRQPAMISYVNGLRALDKVYLDTTFAVNEDPYRTFPTKAQGLSKLLAEVSKFPDNTRFHLNTWTLGYEEVWVALSAHLKSQIHVDDYKWRLYSSLAISNSTSISVEGAALCGFHVGNHRQLGCLTRDDSVRLHSCEYGTRCKTIETSANTVWITPLVSHSEEGIIPEVGAGGGCEDLVQNHELELADSQTKDELIELCRNQISSNERLDQTIHLIQDASRSRRKGVALNRLGVSLTEDTIPLRSLAHLLSKLAEQDHSLQDSPRFLQRALHGHEPAPVMGPRDSLENSSRRLWFPYSRHSSYDEMCHFLAVLKPMDVYPCVTDEVNSTSGVYIEMLFGRLCSGSSFSYDDDVRLVKAKTGGSPSGHSSLKDVLVRLDTTSPEHVLPDSHRTRDLASRASTSGPLKSVGSATSEITLSSSNSKRRQSISRSSPRKKAQTTSRMYVYESTKRKSDKVVTGSLSVWMESSDIDSDSLKRTETELAEDSNIIALVRGRRASASSARISTDGEESHTPSTACAMQSQDKPGSWNERHCRPEVKCTGYPSSVPTSKGTCTGIQPCSYEDGMQLCPNDASDISVSNTEARLERDPRTRSDKAIEKATNLDPDPNTQLSTIRSNRAQSNLGSAETVSTWTPDAHRIQHCKHIYDLVSCDDGYAWGNDCVLFSTDKGREDKEVEI